MGNTPKRGDYLAWSESSAINYVNSVLGARTNRNSMGIDMLCDILGKAPLFGLLTDEGRQAVWLIDVKTTKLPHPEMLGSAIGLKVMEDVSYITGMDRFIKGVDAQSSGYLKDLGAATASNGAVGLYHMEGVTPEAVDKGRDLLNEGYQTYTIDDAELDSYGVSIPINCPMMWCSTPVEGAELVATNSNKTRVYTTARFFFDDVLTELIVTGKLPTNVA
jgi:hypothetical protein